MDEPIADPYVMRTWMLAQMHSAPIALSFLGWEEMLAGHTRYFFYEEQLTHPPLAHTLASLAEPLRDGVLLPFLRALHAPYRYDILRNIDINRHQVTYLLNSALFKGQNRKNASPFLYRYFNPDVFTQHFHRLSEISGDLNPSLYFDIKTSLPDKLLAQYDRLFNARQLTLLSPFLDNRLVEFLAELPDSIKFHENVPASLLRELMQRVAPQTQHTAEKSPLSLFSQWTHHKRLHALFSALQGGRLVEEGIISKKWLQTQVAYPDLTPSGFEQLWSILILEIWFRLFINRPMGKQSHEVSVETLFES